MKKTSTILGFLAVFPAGVALADDDCFVPMADWRPRDAVVRLAEENGWTVRRIKINDGCWGPPAVDIWAVDSTIQFPSPYTVVAGQESSCA